MVVAGINSAGLAGDRGPTSKLDVGALGYRRTDGEVRYYSYAADGGPYVPADTLQDLERLGGISSPTNSARCSGSSPDARSTSSRTRRAASWSTPSSTTTTLATDPTFPPLGTVVTLSSPHEGAPLATVAAQLRGSAAGRVALDAAEDAHGSLPHREPGGAGPLGAFEAHRRRAARRGARPHRLHLDRRHRRRGGPRHQHLASRRRRDHGRGRQREPAPRDRAGPGGVAGGPRRARGPRCHRASGSTPPSAAPSSRWSSAASNTSSALPPPARSRKERHEGTDARLRTRRRGGARGADARAGTAGHHAVVEPDLVERGSRAGPTV